MAYTYTQLTKAYAAVHGYEPTGEAASQLLLMTNASYTDAQRMAYILNSADQSTAVAVLSYQFFTGKAPSAEGLAYLTSSTANPNNLNSDTYAKFNLENRFMNFATNLALEGEAKAAFEANYGSMTYAQYVASIYETIIGKTQATAAGLNAEQTIADIVARQDLILLSARNNGVIGPNATQAEIDLALKAATAAYLLAEGIKADVGIYAGATNNFMIGVATGKAVYGTDITKTYAPTTGSGSTGNGQTVNNPPPIEALPGLPPPPAPEPQGPTNQTFTLTTGTDKFTGGAGDDSFIGTDATFNNSDVLDGGAGHDTLTLTATGHVDNAFAPNATTTGIETLVVTSDGGVNLYTPDYAGLTKLTATAGRGPTNITSTSDVETTLTVTGQADTHIGVYGGSDVTVTSTGVTTGSITVGTTSNFATPITGDVVVSRETAGAASAGSITVTGGKTISITQTATNAVGTTQDNGAVQVNGTDLTTEVTIKAAKAVTADGATAGVRASVVQIYDVNRVSATLAGTIAKVDVDSYTSLSVITNALTDLTLSNGSGDVLIGNSGLTTPTNKTLDLKVSGLTGGTLDDAEIYETLNVTTGAAASTLANITFGGLKTLNVAGDSRLTLTSTAGMSALETVKLTGAASLTANLSGATVTSVDASDTTGASTLTMDGAKATFTGGAGVDRITLGATTVSKDISLGAGDDRLIVREITGLSATAVMDGGDGNDGVETFASIMAAHTGELFRNFESLQMFQNVGQFSTVDMSKVGLFNTIILGGGGTITLEGLAALTTLTTISATGGVFLDGDFSGATALTSVSSAVGSSVRLDGSRTSFTGDLGVDTVAMAATTVSKAINLGGGDDRLILTNATGLTAALDGGTGTDTLVMTAGLASTLSAGTPSILNFETLELASAAGQLIDLSALGEFKTLKVTGSNINITKTGETLTSVDASAMVGGVFEFTSGALTGAVTVKGASANANQVDLSAAANTVTYIGGSGDDTITVKNGTHTITLDAGADKVFITSAANDGSTPLFATIDGFGDQDQLTFLDAHGASGPAILGSQSGGGATLAQALDAAAAGNGAAVSRMSWFQYGTDTYIVLDNSAANTFQAGVDNVVKLTGLVELAGSQVSGGVLTYGAPS